MRCRSRIRSSIYGIGQLIISCFVNNVFLCLPFVISYKNNCSSISSFFLLWGTNYAHSIYPNLHSAAAINQPLKTLKLHLLACPQMESYPLEGSRVRMIKEWRHSMFVTRWSISNSVLTKVKREERGKMKAADNDSSWTLHGTRYQAMYNLYSHDNGFGFEIVVVWIWTF